MSRALVPPNAVVERSGAGETYIINEKGEKLIAASRRADGSIRKAIKVRPGFMPIEERERFVSRGTAIRRGIEEARLMPPGVTPDMCSREPSRKSKKKKGNARKPVVGTLFEIVEDVGCTSPPPEKEDGEVEETRPVLPQDPSKLKDRHKLLKSKLNDARALKRRIDQGHNLLANQEEKVNKIPDFEEELRMIEDKLEALALQ
eukprot:Blabericola_migrator_1__3968@NODE_21_length_22536_cov_99_458098_g18_i0_p13_GENE_NODE_21_length_22536_cov_99_458098_g18_i0NODE_21_length_22536_cov_99_458098_g18_i0_p13_ORF_typecomplete_len203_score29_71Magobind/PF09282_10/2_1e13bZIP_Maf/PF03131_17/0_0018Med9/PF07544_13/0_98_NODE_21_length_22536_cov_99_458098_g18_i059426550